MHRSCCNGASCLALPDTGSVPLRSAIKDTTRLDRPSEYLQEGHRSGSGTVFQKASARRFVDCGWRPYEGQGQLRPGKMRS